MVLLLTKLLQRKVVVGPETNYTVTVLPSPTKPVTYGDPNKHYTRPSIPLKGNTPLVGTGIWSQISGPNHVNITDPNLPETSFTGHIPGEYEFEWEISNQNCKEAKGFNVSVIPPPGAIDDDYHNLINNNIIGNVSDNDILPAGGTFTFTLTDSLTGLDFNPDGTFTHVPDLNFVGTKTFEYEVCDADPSCVKATVRLRYYGQTTVNLTPTNAEMTEGGKITYTARLESPIPEDVIIKVNYDPTGTAENSKDYNATGTVTFLIKAGDTTTSQTITLTAIKDDIKEPDELISVRIESASSIYVNIGNGTDVTIHDIFPTADPVIGKNENPDIKPDPMFSPNDDGLGNEEFFIYNISKYPENEVVIFNRWGNEVYRIRNYDNNANAFRGRANRGLLTNTNEDLVDGVYYYLIYTKAPGNIQKLNSGYVILKRKK